MANKKIKQAAPRLADHSKTPMPVAVAGRQKFSMSRKLALLLAAISFLVYANTINNGFTLDDSAAINDNTLVSKGVSAIPDLLSTPYHYGAFITNNDLYRPLSLVMFAIENQFFGKTPVPNHFFNVVLFACCVVLLFFFLDSFFERKKIVVAFIAALLFALHPVHTEVVASIKSADELLCFFFAFLSLNVFLRYIDGGKMVQLLSGTLCFFLSLLSKETTITFIGILPLIFFFYLNTNKKRSLHIVICSVLVAGIFLAIRFSVLNFYHANEIAKVEMVDNALANPGITFASRIATAILILGNYVKLLFIPYPLICDYSFNTIPYVSFGSPLVLGTVAVYLFLLVFGIRRFIKNHKDPYAFGIFFFLVTIALFSNILFLIGTTMGERLLFFPSVGFCLAAGLLIEKAGRIEEGGPGILKSKIALAIVIPVSVAFLSMTIIRNSEWSNNYTLYSADIRKAPQSAKLNFWLGLELIKTVGKEEKDPSKQKEIKQEGINYIKRSIAIYPDFDDPEGELCAAYFRGGQYDSAEIHGQRAIRLNPNNPTTLNNLGSVYFTKNEFATAIVMYKKAMKIKPDYVEPYTNAAISYLSAGRFDSGVYFLNMAISVDPSYNASYAYLAMAYKNAGKIDSSKKYEAIANKNDPGFKL